MSVPLASVEGSVARVLLADAVADDGELSPYLARYLAEHVGAARLWELLTEHDEVLDRVDPTSVAVEAFRTGYGGSALPPPVVTTMVAHAQLHSSRPEQRRLTRALAARRLGFDDARMSDPRVRWARLARISPHVPLTGHTDTVAAVAFGRLPDGRTLLATGSSDETVRLWDPGTGTPISASLTGHTRGVTAVAFGRLPDGRTLLATGRNARTVRLWDPGTGTPIGAPLTGRAIARSRAEAIALASTLAPGSSNLGLDQAGSRQIEQDARALTGRPRSRVKPLQQLGLRR
jgi:WD40 repeat protein